MTAGIAGAVAAGAGAAAVIAQATKASGAIVRVEPEDFLSLVRRAEAPLVVTAEAGVFSKKSQYLMGYGGLVFFTKSSVPLALGEKVELIQARKIWIPSG